MPKTACPASRLPHLQRDRHGTFYFRLTVAGKTLRRSLRTKDRALATMLASRLNWEWSMTQRGKEPTVSEIVEGFKKQGRKFDAEFSADGSAKFTGINSDDDLRRAKELMQAKRDAAIEAIEPHIRPLLSSPGKARSHFKGKPFSKANKPYLLEKEHGNNQKTREDKEATYAAFIADCGDMDMGAIDKPTAVAFKQKLLGGGAGAARVNKKLGHMSDFFNWAIANGEAEANPFEGLRISSKSKLQEQVESYEPFSAEDLGLIFNATTWADYASKPHFHWLPFLLLYTGARPNELAASRSTTSAVNKASTTSPSRRQRTATANARCRSTRPSWRRVSWTTSPSVARMIRAASSSHCCHRRRTATPRTSAAASMKATYRHCGSMIRSNGCIASARRSSRG